MKRTLGILGVLTVVGGCRLGTSGEENNGAVAVPEGRDGGASAPDRPSASESGPAAPAPPGVKDAGPGPGGNASIDGPLAVRLPVDSGRLPDASSASLPGMPPATLDPKNLLAGVFNPNVLHRIEITVAAEHVPVLAGETRVRVPCTFSFDGVVVDNVGIRRKGFSGSVASLGSKTGFSIKLNEFVKGQKLGGLSKLIINNAAQDPSYMSEHVGYELYRMAGLPAPLTAHALLIFNGKPKGLFVLKEAINKDFLARNFGDNNDHGNLYEGTYPADPGNISAPRMQLKNEKEEMRSRADMTALHKASTTTPNDQWEAVMAKFIDIPSFQKTWAIEGSIGHVDGYFWGPNNFYMYNNPATGKFEFIPHGMDRTFVNRADPKRKPQGAVARRMFEFPALAQPVHNEMTRLIMRGELDTASAMKRIDAAFAVIRAQVGAPGLPADLVGNIGGEIKRFKAAITSRRQTMTPERRPGEGTGLKGDYFNDTKLTEFVGTRIDPMLRFYWHTGAPMVGMNSDTFAVRWTGFIQAEHTELYEIAIASDDGVRLWIDGNLIVNDWTGRDREVRASVALEAGRKHEVKLEYLQEYFLASIYLYWSSPSLSRELVPTFRMFPAP